MTNAEKEEIIIEVVTQRREYWQPSGRDKDFDGNLITEDTAKDLVLLLRAKYPKCQWRIVKVTTRITKEIQDF